MQNQDPLILLKLISLDRSRNDQKANWRSFDHDQYSVRSLGKVLGISKTAVSSSINRSINSGLAIKDREFEHPKANAKALLDFILCGIKYVFPVKPGPLTRGVSTSFSAPLFENILMSAGETKMVWPYAEGSEKGQSIEPLYKSVPYAIQSDQFLYECLALVDAIRVGKPRESNIAKDELSIRLRKYG